LTEDPDNTLARSYLGQAHVAQGDLGAARDQLRQIRARGGRDPFRQGLCLLSARAQ